MSKVNWAIAGVLVLALGGCGGQSAETEPKRAVKGDVDAGGREDETDAGSSGRDDDDMDDDGTDDQEGNTDDGPSGTGSVAPGGFTPTPNAPPGATGPTGAIGPTGAPVAGGTGASGPIGPTGAGVPIGPTASMGPRPIPAPTGPTGAPLPPGDCAEYSSSGTGYCSTEYHCSNQYSYTGCSRVGDRWQCNCSTEKSSANYDLSGVDEVTACETMNALCQSGETLTFDGPEQCNRGDNGDSYSCQAVERCGPSADLGGGVTAWQVASENFAYCYQYDEMMTATCDCGTGDKYNNLLLSGAAFPSVCAAVFDVCTADEPIEFSDAEVCTEPYSSESSSSCNIQEECTRSADLGGGLVGEVRVYRGAYCQDAGDTWTCTCDSNGKSVGFNLAPASDPSQTCNDAMDLCAKVQEAEPTGDVTCEFSSRNSSPDSCGQSDTCGAAAEVDGATIDILGYVNTNCYRSGEGTWTCDCYSGNNYESFEYVYMSTAASRDVCSAAMVDCQNLIEVDFSGGGGMIGRPIPIDIAPTPVDPAPVATSSR